MDQIKQIIYLVVMTIISVCFIQWHSTFISDTSEISSVWVEQSAVRHTVSNEYGTGNIIKASNNFNSNTLNSLNSNSIEEQAVTTDAGFRLIVGFYEKYTGKQVPEASAISNAYGTDDKYLCFALNNGILDFHAYLNLDAPLTKQGAVSMLYALINHNDMQSVDRTCLNMINTVTDLTEYSHIHSAALELCKTGIIGCNSDGAILADEPATFSYITNALKSLENPALRQHFTVKSPAKSDVKSFEAVFQNPELPTGCEVTSLTAVLNHLGYHVDKVTLAGNYLDKGEIGHTDYRRAFVGDPTQYDSYGCYAPVIVNCANKYLAEKGSSMRAYDLTGSELCSLYSYLDKGIPVIVWTTTNLAKSYPADRWIIGTNEVVWTSKEHCVVLYGYNEEACTLSVSDPLVGNVEYERELFEERYKELFSQAVIIR